MPCQRPVCEVEGCRRPTKYRKWCGTHYERWRKHGTMVVQRRAVGTGTINSRGYKEFERDGQTVLEHREVMATILGRPLARHEHVHHVDHNPLNNAPENLQLVTSHTHKKLHAKYFRNATHKECALCRQILPRNAFYPRQVTEYRDPHSFYCRVCGAAQTRRYYQRLR